MSLITAEVDYTGIPFNLTLTNGTTDYVNISVIDDNIAECLEVIQLNLSTLASQSDIYLDKSVVEIWIMDNDCKLLSDLCCKAAWSFSMYICYVLSIIVYIALISFEGS